MCPVRGSASGSPRRGPDVSGAGQGGVDFLGLGVPWGGAPLVLEKTGQVGLGFAKTRLFVCFSSNGKKDNEMTIYDTYILSIAVYLHFF